MYFPNSKFYAKLLIYRCKWIRHLRKDWNSRVYAYSVEKMALDKFESKARRFGYIYNVFIEIEKHARWIRIFISFQRISRLLFKK